MKYDYFKSITDFRFYTSWTNLLFISSLILILVYPSCLSKWLLFAACVNVISVGIIGIFVIYTSAVNIAKLKEETDPGYSLNEYINYVHKDNIYLHIIPLIISVGILSYYIAYNDKLNDNKFNVTNTFIAISGFLMVWLLIPYKNNIMVNKIRVVYPNSDPNISWMCPLIWTICLYLYYKYATQM